MGQQQLLLVILVTIIVGIATVVAINTFGSAADNANVDSVRQDLVQIAAAAQGYYTKPEALGGGGRDFAGITFTDMGSVSGDVTSSGTVLTNENGEYTRGTITAGVDGDFLVAAVPATGGGIQIRVCPDDAVMGDYNPDGAGTAPGGCPGTPPPTP